MDSSSSDRPQGRTALIGRELDRYKVEIAALSETRFAEEGLLKEVGAGYTLFWNGRKERKAAEAGVGFDIKSHLVSRLSGLPKGINDRLVTLRLPLSGPRVKLASYKSTLNPPVVYSTDCSKAVVPVLDLLFVALWFILRGDLLYVFPCVILFLCFSVRLVLRLPRMGKRELILVLYVRLVDLCLFGFVGFLYLLGSGKSCGL